MRSPRGTQESSLRPEGRTGRAGRGPRHGRPEERPPGRGEARRVGTRPLLRGPRVEISVGLVLLAVHSGGAHLPIVGQRRFNTSYLLPFTLLPQPPTLNVRQESRSRESVHSVCQSVGLSKERIVGRYFLFTYRLTFISQGKM